MGEGCRETTVWMAMQPPLGVSDAYNSINSEDGDQETLEDFVCLQTCGFFPFLELYFLATR